MIRPKMQGQCCGNRGDHRFPNADRSLAIYPLWRVGSKVPVNVYEGDRIVCQCQTPEYAARIVAAMNAQRGK